MIARRSVLSLITLAPYALASSAQESRKRPLVAILSPSPQGQAMSDVVGSFLAGLADHGYVDGKNIALDFRFADGALDRLPALAAELVALRPDVFYTHTSGGAEAAAQATKTIPIVVGPASEHVTNLLVRNLARPVGNVTGVMLTNPELDQKCIQLLKEAVPSVVRVAVLVNPDNPAWHNYPGILAEAASILGVEFILVEARGVGDLPTVFATMTAKKADALFAVNDAQLVGTAKLRR